MGLPIRMVAAATPNDIVHRTLQTGDFSLSEVVLQTWATAMDIQVHYQLLICCITHYTFCLKVPYNVERMVLMACGLDTERVGVLMKEFYAETKTSIPEDILNIIRGWWWTASVSIMRK